MVKLQKHGLGNGLASLIPKDVNTNLIMDTTERIHKLSVNLIEPNLSQPRRHFDENSLQELAESIKKHGVLQPIIVSPKNKEKFLLIAGERRWRAAKIAGITTIPAVIRSLKELEQLEIAMIENVQRVDLSPFEQALSIEKLHQQFSLSYDSIAKRLGKALSTVNNIARLLQLPPEVIDALNKKIITEGHARSILALKDFPEHQQALFKECINGWSVRQAERYVTSIKSGVQDHREARARVAIDTPDTKILGKKLKTQVHIRRMAKGGRLEIVFTNDQELKRIINQLGN